MWEMNTLCVIMSIAKLLFVYCLLTTIIIGVRSGKLEDKFFAVIEKPDYEALERTETEIRHIQFTTYNENVFYDSGEGIREENWQKIVETMGKFYKIPEDGIAQLKTASMMDVADRNFHNFEIGGKGAGEFGYMRVAVHKTEDGKIEYILAGTQIKFSLAPVTEETTTPYLAKFEHIEQAAVLSQALEEKFKDYFIHKALLAAGKKYGYIWGRETYWYLIIGGCIGLVLLLIVSLKKPQKTGNVTLGNKMRGLILNPNHEIMNTEKEIKQIQFERYQEVSYHDSSSGIGVGDWDEVVNKMANKYRIAENNIGRLKNAKIVKQRATNYKYKLSEEKRGRFAYLQILVRKEDGSMSYKLVGTQVDFKIKPVVKRKTTIDLFFHKIEHGTDEIVPAEVENRLENYFLYKAHLSARLHTKYKES